MICPRKTEAGCEREADLTTAIKCPWESLVLAHRIFLKVRV